jgi:hypothetical protein
MVDERFFDLFLRRENSKKETDGGKAASRLCLIKQWKSLDNETK